jgi:ABC-type phosphate transport system substrate-binding protein
LQRTRKFALAGAGLVATLAGGVGIPAEAAPPFYANESVQPTAIIGSGSDTTYTLMSALSLAYNESEGCELVSVNFPETGTENVCKAVALQPSGVVETENYDHDVAWGYFPQGSNAGRRQLCSQTTPRPAGVPFVTYARSSSAPAVGFQCPTSGLTLRFVAYAKDALTWTKWAPNTVSNLTQSQLNDIFVDCTITNWSSVGGASQPITVWAAIPGSGSRSTWDSFVGGASDNCIPVDYKDGNNATPVACPGERVIREHQMAPVESDACVAEDYSIYYASVGVHNANAGAKGSSSFGNVDGFDPSEANIQSGDFPYSRFMYNVIRQAGPAPLVTPQTAGFVGTAGWICKPAAQHSEPVGDPGSGIERSKATENWNTVVLDTIRNDGFIPIRTSGNKCDFTDVTAP